MKKLLSIIVLGLLLSGNAYSFTKKQYYFESEYCSAEALLLTEPLIGEPNLKLYENSNFVEPWISEEAVHWHSNDNFMIFATLADYSGKKPEDLFILKLKRKKPIKLEVIYLSFVFEKDYFDFIGYKYNQKPFILDSKQIKRLITANKMNKTSDNKLAKLLVNEIYYSDSISFYGPGYGLKKNSVNQDCDSELKLINKPEKIF